MIPRRVTLVTAPTPHKRAVLEDVEPALGILTLAAVLRPDFDVHVVELNALWNQVDGCPERFHRLAFETIAASDAQVYGFSSICASYPATVRLANAIGHESPMAGVVLGGPQASVVDVATLRSFPGIEAVIRGEAEDNFPKWVAARLEGRSPGAIPGLTYRKAGRIQRNKNASVTLDLDGVPVPAYDLHPGIEKLENLPLEIGRGCPFACRFCSTNDFFRRRFRLKSPAVALSQMRALHAVYGVRAFSLAHDMFTVDRRRVVDFCDEMNLAGRPFSWSCSARTDCVDDDLLERMKDAGCTGVFFGIETGSQRLQRVIEKDLDLNESRRIIRVANSIGLQTTASLITGYPEETREDFRDTVRFFLDVCPLEQLDAQLHILSPLAETPITTQFEKQLYLEDGWEEISETGATLDVVDRLLVGAHPDLFSSFYCFPCELSPVYLRTMRDFIVYATIRANALVQAITRIEPDILNFLESWRGDTSQSYFESWEFVVDFTLFVELRYGDECDPGVRVLTGFYRSLARSHLEAARTRPYGPVRLSCDLRFIETGGALLQVLGAVRRGEACGSGSLVGKSSVAVRLSSTRRCEMTQIPEIATLLFRLAEVGTTVADIVSAYQASQDAFGSLPTEELVSQLLSHYENIGLITLPPPEPNRELAFCAPGVKNHTRAFDAGTRLGAS